MFSLFVESRVGNSNRARVRIHTEDRESVVKYVYIYIYRGHSGKTQRKKSSVNIMCIFKYIRYV